MRERFLELRQWEIIRFVHCVILIYEEPLHARKGLRLGGIEYGWWKFYLLY